MYQGDITANNPLSLFFWIFNKLLTTINVLWDFLTKSYDIDLSITIVGFQIGWESVSFTPLHLIGSVGGVTIVTLLGFHLIKTFVPVA